MLEHERAALEAAAQVDPDELALAARTAREHFGFADGLSQPFCPGPAATAPGDDPIAAGEILLGYPNAYDRAAASAAAGTASTWAATARYLVFRKLAQDVAGFWGWLAAQAAQLRVATRPTPPS